MSKRGQAVAIADQVSGMLTETSSELAMTAASAEQQHEIQAAVLLARRFPRDEVRAFEKLMAACSRPAFAEECAYEFPRGKKEDGSPNLITGPSVYLAREAARVWGNIRYGLSVLRDDDEGRLIRGWAWDMETNVKVLHEDAFAKLIQRKQKDGSTRWVQPDERDLRELTNRRGAILVRNCLLQVMPADFTGDALFRAEETLRNKAAKDPDAMLKRCIVVLNEARVTVAQAEERIGHPLAKATPDELTQLLKVAKSIIDGNSRWDEGEAKAEPRTEPAAEGPLANPPQEVPSQTAEAPVSRFTDAATWDKIIEALDTDRTLVKLKQDVKQRLRIKSLFALDADGRALFWQTLQAEAEKWKIILPNIEA